jgi:hypothetical protein
VHGARGLYDHESLNDELEFLRVTFRWNIYGDWQIQWALSTPKRVALPLEKPLSLS